MKNVLLVFLFLFTIFDVIGQKMDSIIYLSVSKGQEYSMPDIKNFHESDILISDVVNIVYSTSVVTYYNDVHADYDYYVFYIFNDNVAIKSRYIQIRKGKK